VKTFNGNEIKIPPMGMGVATTDIAHKTHVFTTPNLNPVLRT
jgi:hypothetical protein